jgi:hypothetical protein
MITPPPGALVTFMYAMAAPRVIDEALAIYPDGRCWRWILAGRTQFDRVGTYQITLNAAELGDVQRIAADLLTQPPPAAPEVPSDAELTITVGLNGAQRRFVLYEGDPKAPIAFNPARQLADKLRKAAERGPLAVLVMTLQAKFGAGAAKGSISYIFENIGSQPIGLLFNENAFRFTVSGKGGVDQRWSSDEGQIGGLTDSAMNYLDGVMQAAVIAPRTRAALAFVDAVKPPPNRRAPLIGRTSGFLTLIYPTPLTDDNYPGDAFQLEGIINL